MQLYRALHKSQGWQLQEERIEYLAQRWYVSASFLRRPPSDRGSPPVNNNNNNNTEVSWEFPTSMLAQRSNNDPMKKITLDYYAHHLEWMKKDKESSLGRSCREEDVQWRDWVQGVLDHN
jgi:hypothetical protein